MEDRAVKTLTIAGPHLGNLVDQEAREFRGIIGRGAIVGDSLDATQRRLRRDAGHAEFEGLEALQLHAGAATADERDDRAFGDEGARVRHPAYEADTGMGDRRHAIHLTGDRDRHILWQMRNDLGEEPVEAQPVRSPAPCADQPEIVLEVLIRFAGPSRRRVPTRYQRQNEGTLTDSAAETETICLGKSPDSNRIVRQVLLVVFEILRFAPEKKALDGALCPLGTLEGGIRLDIVGDIDRRIGSEDLREGGRQLHRIEHQPIEWGEAVEDRLDPVCRYRKHLAG
ncbi:hypothetical protein D9M68_387320 [compost metagenome]